MEGEEDQERGAKQWVNHDKTPEDDTLEEMYMHNTLPVAPQRERLLVKLKIPKLMDYEEMEVLNKMSTEQETNKEPKDEIDKKRDNQATKK